MITTTPTPNSAAGKPGASARETLAQDDMHRQMVARPARRAAIPQAERERKCAQITGQAVAMEAPEIDKPF